MAEPIVAVEVENRYFIELLRPRHQEEGLLHLTTIEKNQQVALVNIFVQQSGKRLPIHTFRIDPVPRSKKGIPKIDLVAEKKSNVLVELKLFVGDKLYAREIVHIKKPFRRIKWKWALLSLLGVVLVLAIVFGMRFVGGEDPKVKRPPEQARTSDTGGGSGTEAAEEQGDPAETGGEQYAADTRPGKGEQPEAAESGRTARQPSDDAAEKTAPGPVSGEEATTERAPGLSDETTSTQGPAGGEDTSTERDSGLGKETTPEPGAESAKEPTAEPDSGAGKESTAAQPPTSGEDATTDQARSSDATPPKTVHWTIYFDPDSDVLTEDSRRKLQSVVEELKDHPDGMVTISGHCALYGTESGRITLSKQRAHNVERYLRRQTWDPEDDPEIEWFGAKRYLTDDRDMQHLNRRVEIELSY
jgi:outer membrane protein OmpA-like peptidoglycan-associated protein